jgi:hypothetical protein
LTEEPPRIDRLDEVEVEAGLQGALAVFVPRSGPPAYL